MSCLQTTLQLDWHQFHFSPSHPWNWKVHYCQLYPWWCHQWHYAIHRHLPFQLLRDLLSSQAHPQCLNSPHQSRHCVWEHRFAESIWDCLQRAQQVSGWKWKWSRHDLRICSLSRSSTEQAGYAIPSAASPRKTPPTCESSSTLLG